MTAGGFLRTGLGAGGARETLRVFLGADGEVVVPPAYRVVYNLRPGAFRRRFDVLVSSRGESMSDRHRLPAAEKAPADDGYTVELNLYDLVASKWKRNSDFAENDRRLPLGEPTGFVYKAKNAGRSGPREPRWPRTAGAEIPDGSLVWICEEPGTYALNPVTGISAQSVPAGITISGLAVSNLGELVATYAGGELGESYDIVFTFTCDGQELVATQTLDVVER